MNLPADSGAMELPWIITIGPFGDVEDWEPLVCGPYERAHALALARAVVEDDELMAVVEPIQPYFTVAEIEDEIVAVRTAAEETPDEDVDEAVYDEAVYDDALDADEAPGGDAGVSARRAAFDAAAESPPPSGEVKAGLARLAERLAALATAD